MVLKKSHKEGKGKNLIVWPGTGDLSLYDGDVYHSLRGHWHTNCDGPEEHMSF